MKKNMKYVSAAVLISALPLAGPALADDIVTSLFSGVAEHLGNDIIGTTTVTPYWHVLTWDWGVNNYNGVEIERQHANWDIVGGRWFYKSYTKYSGTDGSTDPYTESHDPFFMGTVSWYMYHCSASYASQQVAMASYSIIVTCSRVSTGVYTPPGPFNVCFHTGNTKLADACSPPDYSVGTVGAFRQGVEVGPSGNVVTTLGWPSFAIEFPFDCWIGWESDHG